MTVDLISKVGRRRRRPTGRSLIPAVVLGLAVAGAVAVAPALQAQAVTGTLRLAETREPVQGARVTLLDESDQRPLARTRTDARGRFTLGAPERGGYLLLFDQFGNGQSVYLLETIPAGSTVRRTVTVQPLARVSGVVVDEASGEKIREARLSLVGSGRAAMSDSEGRFELDGVPPGRYPVRVDHLDQSRVIDTLRLALGEVVDATVRVPTRPFELDEVVARGRRAEDEESRSRGFAGDYAGPEEMARISEKAHDFADVLRQMGSPRIRVTRPANNNVGAGFCIRVHSRKPNDERCPPILVVVDGQILPVLAGHLPSRVGGAPFNFTLERLDDLNPEEIRSVQVLGPVEGTSRFGYRGRFGAIVVETREERR